VNDGRKELSDDLVEAVDVMKTGALALGSDLRMALTGAVDSASATIERSRSNRAAARKAAADRRLAEKLAAEQAAIQKSERAKREAEEAERVRVQAEEAAASAAAEAAAKQAEAEALAEELAEAERAQRQAEEEAERAAAQEAADAAAAEQAAAEAAAAAAAAAARTVAVIESLDHARAAAQKARDNSATFTRQLHEKASAAKASRARLEAWNMATARAHAEFKIAEEEALAAKEEWTILIESLQQMQREADERAAVEAAEAARQEELAAEMHAAELASPWGVTAASTLADRVAVEKNFIWKKRESELIEAEQLAKTAALSRAEAQEHLDRLLEQAKGAGLNV